MNETRSFIIADKCQPEATMLSYASLYKLGGVELLALNHILVCSGMLSGDTIAFRIYEVVLLLRLWPDCSGPFVPDRRYLWEGHRL